ncbi:15835_t:CDS:1, partial [Gigaspora rosea]
PAITMSTSSTPYYIKDYKPISAYLSGPEDYKPAPTYSNMHEEYDQRQSIQIDMKNVNQHLLTRIKPKLVKQ